MTLRAIALILAVAAAGSARAQRSVNEQHLSAVDQWIQKSYQATDAYRSGDRIRALELLGTLSKEEQQKAVAAIRGQAESSAAGIPPKKEEVIQWTPRLLRALGALHMEAAIAAHGSGGGDAGEIVEHHISLATTAFGAAATLSGEPDTFTARWVLAIGLERLANADFADAYDVLIPQCHEKQTYAPLFVACGTLHETFASLTADQLRRMNAMRSVRSAIPFTMTIGRTMQELGRARGERNAQLELARKYFERALRLDPVSTEALLRAGQVRMQQKDERGAAEILEKLIALPSLDERDRYLARLFLARIRDRQVRLDEAATLLEQATIHQSSLIARAHNAQRRGNAREAAALVDRAALPATDDPWWGYRYGQYWLRADLFKELRAEARK